MLKDILYDIEIEIEVTFKCFIDAIKNFWSNLTTRFSRTLFKEKGNKIKLIIGYKDFYGEHYIYAQIKDTFHNETFRFASLDCDTKKEAKRIFKLLKRQKYRFSNTENLTEMSYHKHNYAMMTTYARTFPVIGLGKGIRSAIVYTKISIEEFDKTSQKMYNDIFKKQNLVSKERVREVYTQNYLFRSVLDEI